MSRVKFPSRRVDGSFCIKIGFAISGSALPEFRSNVEDWVSMVWMPSNITWTRQWRTGVNLEKIIEQKLVYEDEFLGKPEVAVIGSSTLQLTMTGKRTSSKFWKDWVVTKLIPDVRSRFPELTEQLYIKNCEERIT